MRLAIVGSRNYTNKNRVYHEINECRKFHEITEIVSGGAAGADTFGVDYAKEHRIKYTVHDAKWDDLSEPCVIKVNSKGKKYNALAGFNRNTDIVDGCDAMIAFWDGRSPGTLDSIEKARNAKKKLRVVRF